MSERFGECTSRAGSDCFICGGTGFSGDALAYVEAQNREEREREYKGPSVRLTVSESSQRIQKMEAEFYRNMKSTPALEAAVSAIQTYIKTQTKKEKDRMSTNLIKTEAGQMRQVSLAEKFGYTEKQLDLVKRTVAKNATDDELELFFYRCKELQLNPLMPGQVYFLKFGNNPGSVIVGLDGFRARAQRTGKLNGIKRGVIRDASGHCIGGWADVSRKDWDHPAHEEVSLHEYADQRKPIWKNMPETMIKKVAEVAALRMAFPDELGGIYSPEEMDQADRTSKPVESHVTSDNIRKPSEAQLKRLFAINRSAGLSNEELKEILLKDYGHESSKDLNLDEYNQLCANLEAKTLPIAKKELEVPASAPQLEIGQWDEENDANEDMAEMK